MVQVSWNDAQAYCQWAGVNASQPRLNGNALPAAGWDQAIYPWGDELTPGGEHMANIWQGKFPGLNTRDDGYLGTCPVGVYPPNGFEIYGAAGNVWEWCSDWFSPNFHLRTSRVNPVGPPQGSVRVMRGGSYLCHDSYCNRYRVGGPQSQHP